MKTDLELGGEVIPAGQIAYVILSAANRDPEVFAQPHELDLTRAENPHMAFGYGSHFCIGAPLARLEAEIALKTFLERVPCYTIDMQESEWLPDLRLRGFKRLMMRLEQ